MNEQQREAVKAPPQLAEKIMRAFYFDRKGAAIGDADDGEPVSGVPDAKHKGRAMGARGFRLWLGKEATEEMAHPWLYYIQPWMNARFQKVHKEGFFRVFEGVISREERREKLQIMRSLLDPAYKEEVTDGGDGDNAARAESDSGQADESRD